MSDEKPRYISDVELLETAVHDASVQLGGGSEGSSERAAIAIGRALERAKNLRYRLWDDFNAEHPTGPDKEQG